MRRRSAELSRIGVLQDLHAFVHHGNPELGSASTAPINVRVHPVGLSGVWGVSDLVGCVDVEEVELAGVDREIQLRVRTTRHRTRSPGVYPRTI